MNMLITRHEELDRIFGKPVDRVAHYDREGDLIFVEIVDRAQRTSPRTSSVQAAGGHSGRRGPFGGAQLVASGMHEPEE